MWTIIAYVFGIMLVIDGVRDLAGRGWIGTAMLLIAATFTIPITFEALRKVMPWEISTRVRIIIIASLIILYGAPLAIDVGRAIYGSAREHRNKNDANN